LISGYDEFAYARKAIDLKVFRYLLKPITPAEILGVVKSLTEEIQEEKELHQRIGLFEEEISKNADILVRQFLHDILYGQAGNMEECVQRAALLSMPLAEGASYVCAAFEADGGNAAEEDNPYRAARMLTLGIYSIAQEVFHRFPSYWVYSDDDNRVYVIAASRQAQELESSLIYCIERLQKAASQNLGVTVSAAIGNSYGSMLEVCQSRREALRALEYKMAAGRESIIHIRDVQSIDSQRFVYPTEEERRIVDAIAREDGTELADAVNAFFKTLSAERQLDMRIKAAVVKLYSVLSMKMNDLNVPVLNDDVLAMLSRHDTLESARHWFLAISAEALGKLSKYREEGVRSVIHSAEKFIQTSFKDMDLSLSMVAEHMGLTSSYFSRLFKQETGSSYIDYVINLRIEHAKRLLRTTTHRIFDIGEMVGYPNSQYFCTLFRKACGVSPAEYREGRDAK
jgi:two-component system, response regulator YesN